MHLSDSLKKREKLSFVTGGQLSLWLKKVTAEKKRGLRRSAHSSGAQVQCMYGFQMAVVLGVLSSLSGIYGLAFVCAANLATGHCIGHGEKRVHNNELQ